MGRRAFAHHKPVEFPKTISQFGKCVHHQFLLIQLMSDDAGNVYRGTHLITVCQNYERIGDRVTNLAEDLVFLDSGEIEELG